MHVMYAMYINRGLTKPSFCVIVLGQTRDQRKQEARCRE